MIRELGTLCDEAKQIITGDRQDQYGNPEDCFELIGTFWSGYLHEILKTVLAKHKFDVNVYAIPELLGPKEVSELMILFKLARCLGQKPSRDNYRDICGYADICANKFIGDENA